eukprot:TRINITY_DN8433_c0_g1_i5.p1 TRINITY_DN8433_c0_g1~~TRINITY_DN8433_c0_g1_i5.p1  ORF type:complete len:383 (+),score=106.69 TRINITY_DN8433_c0_g1_i5:77-1150(+)
MAAEAAARSRALLHGPSLLCCSLCERQTAAVDCATCKASMCQPCAASLHKTGVHARHKLFPLGQGGPEPRECPRHAGEVLNLYCRGTGEVVCGACATARGITDCEPLLDAFAAALTRLRERLLKAEELAAGADRALDRCVSARDEISAESYRLQQHVRGRIEALCAVIKARGDALCAQIAERERRKQQRVVADEELLQARHSRAQDLLGASVGLLAQRSAHTLFGQGRVVEKLGKLEDFVAAGLPDPLPPAASFRQTLDTEALTAAVTDLLRFEEDLSDEQRGRLRQLSAPAGAPQPAADSARSPPAASLLRSPPPQSPPAAAAAALPAPAPADAPRPPGVGGGLVLELYRKFGHLA